MWFFKLLMIYNFLFSVGIFLDSRKRGANALLWTIGSFIFSPLAVSIYNAVYPAQSDEKSKDEISLITLIIIYFAIFWSSFIACVFMYLSISEQTAGSAPETIGCFTVNELWVIPIIVVTLIGLFLKYRFKKFDRIVNLSSVDNNDKLEEKRKKPHITWSRYSGLAILGAIILALLDSRNVSKIDGAGYYKKWAEEQRKKDYNDKLDLSVVKYDLIDGYDLGGRRIKYIKGDIKNNSAKVYGTVFISFGLYDENDHYLGDIRGMVNDVRGYETKNFDIVVTDFDITGTYSRAVRVRLSEIKVFLL